MYQNNCILIYTNLLDTESIRASPQNFKVVQPRLSIIALLTRTYSKICRFNYISAGDRC